MPQYVIERQFLLPMYEHVLVEAESLDEACRHALDDLACSWGDDSQLDFDSCHPTTIERVVEIPEHLCPELGPTEGVDRHSLSELLYDSDLEPLPIPSEFVEEANRQEPIGFF